MPDDSGVDHSEGDDVRVKKRRTNRACDGCRRRKVRCDVGERSDGQCSGCVAHNVECTFETQNKRRAGSGGNGATLDSRLAKMEDLLEKVAPTAKAPQTSKDAFYVSLGTSRPLHSTHPTPPLSPHGRQFGITDPPEPQDSEDEGQCAAAMENLTLDESFNRRFHGKSSGYSLYTVARDLKRVYTGGDDKDLHSLRRPKFWDFSEWKWDVWHDARPPHSLEFAPPDLERSLIDLFFINASPFAPAIHRGSFEENYANNLHKTDIRFAALVLLICATGSKFSSDPRTTQEDVTIPSGFKYFVQVKDLYKSVHAPVTLFDLQGFVLIAWYLFTSSETHSSWTVIGIGLRYAMDVGAHRRKHNKGPLSREDEQWKRAFWSLIVLDRTISCYLGRPLACQDEDIDIEYPIPEDDAEERDILACFNCSLKLFSIQSIVLRTIYSITKSRILSAFSGPQWEQHVVAELDSALNQWIDTIPSHLRWDPNRENLGHFEQSVHLHASYYYLQILIHRPFIPAPNKPSALSFPSLSICTNAARSCSHVVDALRRRSRRVMPTALTPAFSSAVVLLIGAWGAKNAGVTVDSSMQMKDIDMCLKALISVEDRFLHAGRLVDILRELASFGDLPLPENAYTPPSASNKRSRPNSGPSDLPSVSSTSSNPTPPNVITPRQHSQPRPSPTTSPSVTIPYQFSPQPHVDSPAGVRFPLFGDDAAAAASFDHEFGYLPFNTADLGRLPLAFPTQNPPQQAQSVSFPSGQDDGLMELYATANMLGETNGIINDNAIEGNQQLMPMDTTFSTSPTNLAGAGSLQTTQWDNVFNSSGNLSTTTNGFDMSNKTQSPTNGENGVSNGGAAAFLGGDALGMWSAAPTGFEWDDWGTLIENLKEGRSS